MNVRESGQAQLNDIQTSYEKKKRDNVRELVFTQPRFYERETLRA